ncbi:MAG: DUF1428 domain-containing protein [Verrucomicrobiales bacterium]
MDKYIDGFVIPVHLDQLNEYKRVATLCATIWKEHGALEYIEAVGDDLGTPGPGCRSATEVFATQLGETLVFAYIVYESKEHRDSVNAKVMADPRMKALCPTQNPDVTPPFDPQRMMFGGYKVVVQG